MRKIPYTMPVVDIYARSAAEEGNTLEAQETACRQYAEQNGLQVGVVYREIASGSMLDRPYIQQIRARYINGESQGFIIETVYRLTRSTVDFMQIVQEAREHNATVYCAKDDLSLKLFDVLNDVLNGLIQPESEV